jgi:hypothetical protein
MKLWTGIGEGCLRFKVFSALDIHLTAQGFLLLLGAIPTDNEIGMAESAAQFILGTSTTFISVYKILDPEMAILIEGLASSSTT